MYTPINSLQQGQIVIEDDGYIGWEVRVRNIKTGVEDTFFEADGYECSVELIVIG